MPKYQPRYVDLDESDESESPAFQPLKKQTGKPQTLKGDRRQEAKEWGRSMHKFHKQRQRSNDKP